MTEKHPDLSLVRAVLDGDGEASERLARRLQCVRPFLVKHGKRFGVRLSDDDLDDLSSDTRMHVLRLLASYRGDAALETWVYPICFQQVMNYGRKRRRRRAIPLEDLEADPAAPASPSMARSADDLEPFLRHLAAREAEIVRLRFLGEMGLEEIAGQLGISSSSVKTSYYRALEKLRKIYRDGESGVAS